jgi:hypothetical protein
MTQTRRVMRLGLAGAAAILLLVLLTTASDASGPSFRKVAADPVEASVRYGLTAGGRLWRSDDGGVRWVPLPLAGVRDFVVRFGGSEGAAAAFGCSCGGYTARTATSIVDTLAGDTFQRSYDRGATWSAIRTSGLLPADAVALSFGPIQHDDMRATLHDGTWVRSLDGGHTWRAIQ